MASIIFAERENASLRAPALKMRQRLQSAPEMLKTPMTGKKLHTPMQSNRKALGAINKITLTPSITAHEKKLPETQQETKTETALQNKVDKYPDIERFIPYDPLEFENYYVPEDVVRLSHLALPGLAWFPPTPCLPEEDFKMIEIHPHLSPMKNPQHSASGCASELDSFLKTINELTVELPPEFDNAD